MKKVGFLLLCFIGVIFIYIVHKKKKQSACEVTAKTLNASTESGFETKSQNQEHTEQDVADLWNENAEVWEEDLRKGYDIYYKYFNIPKFLKFITKSVDLKGRNVLDAGCGEGYFTRILAKEGPIVVGLDIAEKQVEFAKQKELSEPLGIKYEVGSFSDLSRFEDNSFDVVVASMSFMDSPLYKKPLKEFFRVLKPGGHFFFSILHPCFFTHEGFNWIEDEKTKETKLLISKYFSKDLIHLKMKQAERPNKDEVKPIVSVMTPRTISTYINSMIEAGFTFKQIKEPRPSVEICKKFPALERWRTDAALFLYIHGQK